MALTAASVVFSSPGWNELLIASFSHRSIAVKDGILLATGLHVHRNSAHSAGVGAIFDRWAGMEGWDCIPNRLAWTSPSLSAPQTASIPAGGARDEGVPTLWCPRKHGIKSLLSNLQQPQTGRGLPGANQSPFHGVQMPSNVTRRPLLRSFSSLIGPRRDFICTMERPQQSSAGSTGVSRGLFNLRLWESVLKPGLPGV